MILVAVEAVPAGSKLSAAVSVRISTGETRLWRRSAFVDQDVISAGESRRIGEVITEAGQTYRVVIDLGRKAIPIHHSICCSVLRTLTSVIV